MVPSHSSFVCMRFGWFLFCSLLVFITFVHPTHTTPSHSRSTRGCDGSIHRRCRSGSKNTPPKNMTANRKERFSFLFLRFAVSLSSLSSFRYHISLHRSHSISAESVVFPFRPTLTHSRLPHHNRFCSSKFDFCCELITRLIRTSRPARSCSHSRDTDGRSGFEK